jgi:hypothetical protein
MTILCCFFGNRLCDLQNAWAAKLMRHSVIQAMDGLVGAWYIPTLSVPSFSTITV